MTEIRSADQVLEDARGKYRSALSSIKQAGGNVASASLDRDRLEETFGHGDTYTDQIREAQRRYEQACQALKEAEQAYRLAEAEYKAALEVYRAGRVEAL